VADQKNIRGLDIAMNDAFGVSGVEGSGHLNSNFEEFVERNRPLCDAMFESLAVEKLHHEKVAALVFVDVVENTNVWVVECGGRARFATETLERVGIARGVVWQELQRDEAAEFSVFGRVDHAHAAATQLLVHAIVGDDLAAQRSDICHIAWILGRTYMQVNGSWGSRALNEL